MYTNLIRLLLISIYPILLGLLLFFILRKQVYKEALNSNWKYIFINTLTITFTLSLLIIVYFKLEDTIYVYDFSGHWIRSLKLRQLFYESPAEILKVVYNSMNFDDYSYLPGLLSLWSIIFNTSYGYFCLTILVNFFVPFIIFSQILYFSYFDKKKYLPILVAITMFPLYFTIFNGEIDLGGMIFVISSIMLIIIPNFENIDIFDNLFINILGFMMIFYRRWYLYSLVAIYICYFIKYIFYFKKSVFSKEGIIALLKIISSGIVLLIVILLLFRPFFINVISNNFEEAYSFYDRDGKLIALINYISPIICCVILFGAYKLFTKNEIISVLFVISIIIPTFMFWNIQSFEHHHYYIILVQLTLIFAYGLYYIYDYRHLKTLVLICLIIQLGVVFSKSPNIPLITNTRKTPEKLEYKQEVIELTYFLKSIITEDWQSAYLASGSSVLSDDMIRNSILPDLDAPQIDTAVLDLRDGFPKDMEYIQYVITIDPIQYLDPNYQHIYSIISHAIWNEPLISDIYSLIYKTKIDDLTICVYEKTGNYNEEIKEYFYNEILKYYPDKSDLFSYVLD